MKTMILAAALISGCVQTQNPAPQTHGGGAKASYLCVGMEYSSRFGGCAGCELDSKRLTSLMKDEFGYQGVTLVSGKATKAAVVGKLTEGIENTPEDGLFIFMYSGHGGQESLGGKEPDGADRKDEYLCLYDTHMLDDEIWEIVSRCRGRVLLYFDACHSATMYRSVASELNVEGSGGKPAAKALGGDLVKSSGFTFRPERFVKARPMSSDAKNAVPRILCWSGCKEAEYSYGGSNGGVMTCNIIRNWKEGMSYSLLWGRVVQGVKSEQPTQNPVQTIVGEWPTLSEAFR